MELQLQMTPAGLPALRYGDQWLDDAEDPIAGAVSFANEKDLDGATRVVVFGTGLGYRLLRLRDLGCDPVVFEPNQEAVAVCHELMPEVLDGLDVFTEFTPFLQYLVRGYRADDSTKLLTSKGYREAYPVEYDKVVRILSDAQGFSRIRENSLEQRTKGMIESALSNLHQFGTSRLAMSLDRPLEKTPVFIVSAGPSLDRNGHLLAKAREHGMVFAVNTSGPCVKMHGSEVDVLVSIEAMDASFQMKEINPHMLALDVTANPKSFAIDSAKKVSFLQQHPAFASLAALLGMPTLQYGASVATAAFRLALTWGADPIVLVGQDLAYTDGHCYATGTGREHGRVYPEGNVMRVETGLEELFKKNGIKPPPKYQPRVEVEAWGGGTVDTAYDLNMFRRWFESAAYVLRGQARYINATEGGANIDGFENMALENVLSGLGPRSDGLDAAYEAANPLPDELVDSVREEIAARAVLTKREAAKCLRTRKKHLRAKLQEQVRVLAKQTPCLETHSAGELVALGKDRSVSKERRFRRTFEIIRDSAARIEELVT